MSKLHFVSVGGNTACGIAVADAALTNDPAEVTCGNCLRTAVVKTALDIEGAVGAFTVAEAE